MIFRVEVQPAAEDGGATASDPLGESVRHQIVQLGIAVGEVQTRRIFLIDADATAEQVEQASTALLADPIVERAEVFTAVPFGDGKSRIEVHMKPGVMDPVAASTQMALRDLGLAVKQVRTGRAYLIDSHMSRDELQRLAFRVLANGVVESVHLEAYLPTQFERGRTASATRAGSS